MPIIQLLIYTDIGKVRVAPKEQTVVIGKGCGELMGGKNLGDLEVMERLFSESSCGSLVWPKRALPQQ